MGRWIFIMALILNILSVTFLLQMNVYSLRETSFYIFLTTIPIELLLIFMIRHRIGSFFIHTASKPALHLYFAMTCAVTIIAATLAFNHRLDSSPAEQKSFTVIQKDFGNGKNSKYYYAVIKRPDFIDLPFFFSDTDRIEISEYEYNILILGESQIILPTHKGAFGFPWYEDYELIDLLPPTLKIQLLHDA